MGWILPRICVGPSDAADASTAAGTTGRTEKKGGLSARRLVIFPMHRLGGTSLPEKCSLSSV